VHDARVGVLGSGGEGALDGRCCCVEFVHVGPP
jgi:hypothetical protein